MEGMLAAGWLLDRQTSYQASRQQEKNNSGRDGQEEIETTGRKGRMWTWTWACETKGRKKFSESRALPSSQSQKWPSAVEVQFRYTKYLMGYL